MDVMEAISLRRTIRSYESTPVPMEHIRQMIQSALWAPSGYNRQPWKFIVVTKQELKSRMADEVRKKVEEIAKWPASAGKENRVKTLVRGYTVFENAPVAIAVITKAYSALIDEIYLEHGLSFEEIFNQRAAPGIQSVAAATENLILAATSLGYGTCWGTGCLVAKDELERILEVEKPWRLVAVLSVGVPRGSVPTPRRKPLEDVMEFR